MQLALGEGTGDLIKGDTGGVVRVQDGRFTIQQTRSKLSTALGEWALDPRVGWVNAMTFTKAPDLYDLEANATRIILGTNGVLSILSLDIEMKARTLLLNFRAETTYGTIDLTVPWSKTGEAVTE
jgi:hypothetical protein